MSQVESLPPQEAPSIVIASPKKKKSNVWRYTKKALKRLIPIGLLAYFLPKVLLIFLIFTWLLSPFNVLMDVLALPYWNKGIYQQKDLPERYQTEVQALIDACHNRDLVGALQSKMGDNKRGMFFFQWYGKMIETSIDIPEFKTRYKYIRTIGVSIFNKKQSTAKHYGPLRVTFRMLYNINTIDDPNVYVQVGDHVNRWHDSKLFIFDDTLQHESINESDGVRYCLFVDILRPSLIPWFFGSIVTAIRLWAAPVRRVFYKHWTIMK
jgi:Aspartyl/Asparaginyl beta-hydroxylase